MKMKYGFFAACSLAACILYLSACGGKEKKPASDATEAPVQEVNRNIKFESYTFDMIGELPDSLGIEGVDNSRYVRIQGEGVLPADLGEADIRMLRDSLMSLAGMQFSEEDMPVPVPTLGMKITDLPPASTDACGYISNTLSASLVNPRVIVFQNEREAYACMAAHGNSAVSYLNYFVPEGRIIHLRDLMKANYQEALAKIVREKVKEAGISLSCDLSEVGIPDQFAISSSGITFSWDPYEIAPYSEGVVTVEVTAGDLMEAGLLSKEGEYTLTGREPQAAVPDSADSGK